MAGPRTCQRFSRANLVPPACVPATSRSRLALSLDNNLYPAPPNRYPVGRPSHPQRVRARESSGTHAPLRTDQPGHCPLPRRRRARPGARRRPAQPRYGRGDAAHGRGRRGDRLRPPVLAGLGRHPHRGCRRLDSTCDRASDAVLFLGPVFYYLLRPDAARPDAAAPNVTMAALAGLGLIWAQVTSYLRARAVAEGAEGHGGFWQRGERVVTMLLGLGFHHLSTAVWAGRGRTSRHPGRPAVSLASADRAVRHPGRRHHRPAGVRVAAGAGLAARARRLADRVVR